jgi:hypothetical protein
MIHPAHINRIRTIICPNTMLNIRNHGGMEAVEDIAPWHSTKVLRIN